MGSPQKRGLKANASTKSSKLSSTSSMGVIVTIGLLFMACSAVFAMGLWVGAGSDSRWESIGPATDHLLRVSGHSISSKSHQVSNEQLNIDSINNIELEQSSEKQYPLHQKQRHHGDGNMDLLIMKAGDSSHYDRLMASLFAHDSESEKTRPPLETNNHIQGTSALPAKQTLETLQGRMNSMHQGPQSPPPPTTATVAQSKMNGGGITEDRFDEPTVWNQQKLEEDVSFVEAAIDAVGESIVASAPMSWRVSLGENSKFAEVVKNVIHDINNDAVGPIESFVKHGGRLPIAVLTANRPDMLKQTLQNLLKVRGARKEDIIVFQDGNDGSVTSVARSLGFDPVKHSFEAGGLRGVRKPDGAALIAASYKFALSRAMSMKPDAPAVIVVEDDFLFSPDFLEYFHHTAPLLERDSSTFILSAWNDNGLKGKVSDRSALCRSLFFPGLGWLLPRKLWEHELAMNWPKEHWDHWLRDPKRHKGRESVYPEVNRDYHAGKKGTFMDDYHHNRYFKDIDYDIVQTSQPSTLSSSASSSHLKARQMLLPDKSVAFELSPVPSYVWGMRRIYEARIEAVLTSKRTLHIADLAQVSNLDDYSEAVLWHRTDFTPPVSDRPPPFKPMADYFNIWHEWVRTNHAGCVHQFRWGPSHTLLSLVNVNRYLDGHNGECQYAKFRPQNAKLFEPKEFSGKLPPLPSKVLKLLKIVKSSNQGESCTETCQNYNSNYQCEKTAFSMVNTCPILQSHFPCEKGCVESYGKEQPAYVFRGAPPESLPGTCLYTSKPADTSCEAKHPLTTRICPCIPLMA